MRLKQIEHFLVVGRAQLFFGRKHIRIALVPILDKRGLMMGQDSLGIIDKSSFRPGQRQIVLQLPLGWRLKAPLSKKAW
jgi:hypothetical protein